MQVTIRKAKPDDLPSIQKLATELMYSDKRFDSLLVGQWHYSDQGKKFLLKEIKGRNHICFLAETDGQAIGYASCKLLPIDSWRPIKRAELDNLVISEKYRSQGVGHQLMDEFKRWAKGRGAVRLKVIVDAHNEQAIRFYKDNGFSELHDVMEARLK